MVSGGNPHRLLEGFQDDFSQFAKGFHTFLAGFLKFPSSKGDKTEPTPGDCFSLGGFVWAGVLEHEAHQAMGWLAKSNRQGSEALQ